MNKPLMTSLDEIAKVDIDKYIFKKILSLRGHSEYNFDHDDSKTLFPVSEIGKLGCTQWLIGSYRLFENDDEKRKLYMYFVYSCASKCKHLMNEEEIFVHECSKKYLLGKMVWEEFSIELEKLKNSYSAYDFYSPRRFNTASLREMDRNTEKLMKILDDGQFVMDENINSNEN